MPEKYFYDSTSRHRRCVCHPRLQRLSRWFNPTLSNDSRSSSATLQCRRTSSTLNISHNGTNILHCFTYPINHRAHQRQRSVHHPQVAELLVHMRILVFSLITLALHTNHAAPFSSPLSYVLNRKRESHCPYSMSIWPLGSFLTLFDTLSSSKYK